MAPVRKPRIHKRYKVATHGKQQPKRIVLHCWQSVGTIEGIAAFWERQGLGYGSQFMFELDGRTGQGASGDEVCWHVYMNNTGSIGYEMEGYAQWTVEQWMAHPRMLEAVARMLAWHSKYWGIRLRRSTRKGVCLHADFHGGHWDPGPQFPIGHVLRMARRYKKLGW